MDLSDLLSYRENNRLEAKTGAKGLPRSLWETYSAFANSSGGVILLGAQELPDKTLVPVGVKNTGKLLDDFWNTVNNPQKASENILLDEDVRVFQQDGANLIAIFVPQANRRVKPIYLNDNPKRSFRRNHTGDYLCKMNEIRSMMRDAADESQDAMVLESAPMDYLDGETVKRYRTRFSLIHEGHVWNDYDDEQFLASIGAVGFDGGEVAHPTVAGLVMFGQDRWITKELPEYFLDYRQELRPEERWQNRFVSFTGDWSGNVFDFYNRAYNDMKQALKVPFKLEGMYRVDDTPAHEALREALVNCITNANYFERRGIVCQWTEDALVIANPGDFRMPLDEARRPGASDLRNAVLLKLFALIESGERAGSGMSKIYAGWADAGYAPPFYATSFDPDRTVLTLPLYGADDVRTLGGASRIAGQDTGQVGGTSQKGTSHHPLFDINADERNESNKGASQGASQGTSQGTSQLIERKGTETRGDFEEAIKERQAQLVEFCIIPRARQEMQEHIGIDGRRYFIESCLKPLLSDGRLIMTIPDKPNSRNQRYVANPNYTANEPSEETR